MRIHTYPTLGAYEVSCQTRHVNHKSINSRPLGPRGSWSAVRAALGVLNQELRGLTQFHFRPVLVPQPGGYPYYLACRLKACVFVTTVSDAVSLLWNGTVNLRRPATRHLGLPVAVSRSHFLLDPVCSEGKLGERACVFSTMLWGRLTLAGRQRRLQCCSTAIQLNRC